jgi:DNA polymerase III alpha subunit
LSFGSLVLDAWQSVDDCLPDRSILISRGDLEFHYACAYRRSAKASTFVCLTLEDETGCANVVVFKDVSARQRRILLGSRLLGVAGILQREGQGEHAVVHLIAKRLFDHSELLGTLTTASRDFH